jgi:hypothetical protein
VMPSSGLSWMFYEKFKKVFHVDDDTSPHWATVFWQTSANSHTVPIVLPAFVWFFFHPPSGSLAQSLITPSIHCD